MIIPGGFGAPGAVLGGTAIKPMATSCGINDLPWLSALSQSTN